MQNKRSSGFDARELPHQSGAITKKSNERSPEKNGLQKQEGPQQECAAKQAAETGAEQISEKLAAESLAKLLCAPVLAPAIQQLLVKWFRQRTKSEYADLLELQQNRKGRRFVAADPTILPILRQHLCLLGYQHPSLQYRMPVHKSPPGWMGFGQMAKEIGVFHRRSEVQDVYQQCLQNPDQVIAVQGQSVKMADLIQMGRHGTRYMVYADPRLQDYVAEQLGLLPKCPADWFRAIQIRARYDYSFRHVDEALFWLDGHPGQVAKVAENYQKQPGEIYGRFRVGSKTVGCIQQDFVKILIDHYLAQQSK